MIHSHFQAPIHWEIPASSFQLPWVRSMPGTAYPLWTWSAWVFISWVSPSLAGFGRGLFLVLAMVWVSLSPQHFPGVPVSMLSAVYIWRKYVLPSLHRPAPVGPEFMLLRLLVTPRAASQIIFPWSSTLRVQNGSCFTANLYYPSEELKALFTGWFSFRHSALTLHKAFQMIFSLLLLFCFPEASIVKILAFSYHRKRQ